MKAGSRSSRADADRLRPHQHRPVLLRRLGHVREHDGTLLPGDDCDGAHALTLTPGGHLNYHPAGLADAELPPSWLRKLMTSPFVTLVMAGVVRCAVGLGRGE